VLDGLKLQPCSPTFVDRNAIIAADQAITGGKDLFDMGVLPQED
jgi:hypothetical protein